MTMHCVCGQQGASESAMRSDGAFHWSPELWRWKRPRLAGLHVMLRE